MKKFLQSLIMDLLNDWRIEQIEIDTEYTDDTGCMFTAVYSDGTEKDRWNRKKACWYAKQSEETISFAFELSNTIGE